MDIYKMMHEATRMDLGSIVYIYIYIYIYIYLFIYIYIST